MPIGRADFWAAGDWNAVCYECGRKRKASTLVRHWQGYYVCREHWEPRQPQDFVRTVQDVQTPAWTQPMPTDSFAAQCFPDDQSAIPNLATPNVHSRPCSRTNASIENNLAVELKVHHILRIKNHHMLSCRTA